MIKVYGKENCGRCETLKRTLERKGLDYELSLIHI